MPTDRELVAIASVLRNPYGSAKGRDYAEQKYREHLRALLLSGTVTDRVLSHLELDQFSRDGIEYPLLVPGGAMGARPHADGRRWAVDREFRFNVPARLAVGVGRPARWRIRFPRSVAERSLLRRKAAARGPRTMATECVVPARIRDMYLANGTVSSSRGNGRRGRGAAR